MNQSKVITPPASEILSLQTVKDYLKIDHTDEDDLLQMLITSARETIQQWCSISIGEQTREWLYSTSKAKYYAISNPTAAMAKRNIDCYASDDETEIPYGPVIAITTVDEHNGTTYATSTDYTTDGLDYKTFRASGGSRWKVRYTAGYTADNVPEGLLLIWKQLIAYLYTNRQDESADMPQYIRYALNPYKRSLI